MPPVLPATVGEAASVQKEGVWYVIPDCSDV